MKWSNPGNEFNEVSDKLIDKYNKKKIYIYGAGLRGKRISRVFNKITDYKIHAFIDRDEEKQHHLYCGKQVVPVEQVMNLSQQELEDSVVIIALEEDTAKKVKLQLTNERKELHCFTYNEFMVLDFPIIAMYKYNKCYLNTASILVTERCTLKCEKCAIMLPYYKDIKKFDIEILIKEVDLLFSKVDMIGNITITGGEPLLFKELNEFIIYIGENYLDRIGSFRIITNGTIEPSKELIKSMKIYGMSVEVSDYSVAVPKLKNKIYSVVDLFRNNNIDTYFLSLAKWVDFGFTDEYKKDMTPGALINFFDYCHTMCRGYIDGEICYCINARLAEKALEKEKDSDNTFSLYTMGDTIQDKRKLVEFDRGYNNRGYLEMCQQCNGTCEINNHYVEVGIQCKG